MSVSLLQKGNSVALTRYVDVDYLFLAEAFHRGFVFPAGSAEMQPVFFWDLAKLLFNICLFAAKNWSGNLPFFFFFSMYIYKEKCRLV